MAAPTNATQPLIQQNTPGQTQLDLAQSRYDFRYLAFPQDLGMDNQGHYMVININVPTGLNGDNPVGAYANQYDLVQPIQRSKVDTLRFRGNVPGRFGGVGGGNSSRPIFALPRSTRRIATSIALHMPTPLVFNHQNAYDEINLTALAGKIGVASSYAVQGLANITGQNWLGSLARGARAISGASGEFIATAAQVAGMPINPMVEILFSTTPVRQFGFEVLMSPRSQYESEVIYEIVKLIRFHGSPEINTISAFGLGAGLLWIPPGEFDITFFNKGVENMNILRINTCVLERCEVDYAPSGVYSTFRNGHPVAVRLSLGFKEVEPLHKERIAQGF